MLKTLKKSSNNKLCILTMGICLAASNASQAADCGQISQPMPVTINENAVVTPKVSANVFGFVTHWYWFQKAHFRNGAVRNETLEYLRPFQGALYRYTGHNSFPWMNAIGDIAKRKRIQTDYYGFQYPEFGPSEFLQMMTILKSDSVFLVDVARKFEPNLSEAEIQKDASAYIDWVQTNRTACVPAKDCSVKYYELGNEVDHEDGVNFSAAQYQKRILPIITDAKRKYPSAKFAVVGRTAPWSSWIDSHGQDYNQELAKGIAPYIDAISFHPYYDGLSIPEINKYGADVLAPFKALNSNVKLLVTEHGRWPNEPEQGNWAENTVNWYQASGSSAAISSADYILSNLNNTNMAGAIWHAISPDGPWQLFHLNKNTDQIYPSPVYWGLRVIRDSFLQTTVRVQPNIVSSNVYGGKYSLRFEGMKDQNGKISLLGINRGNDFKLKLVTQRKILPDSWVKVNYLIADQRGSDNTDSFPDQFVMKTDYYRYSQISSGLCLPGRSVFSLLVE